MADTRRADIEAAVRELYAALRRPPPAIVVALDPAAFARAVAAAARPADTGFGLLVAGLYGVSFPLLMLWAAFAALARPSSWPFALGSALCALVLHHMAVHSSNRRTLPTWLERAPTAMGLAAGAGAGLVVGGVPGGLMAGILAAVAPATALAGLRAALGRLGDRLALRWRTGQPVPPLGAKNLQPVLTERLRGAAEGTQTRPNGPEPERPDAAGREAVRRIGLLLDRAGWPLLSRLKFGPALGAATDGFEARDRRRAARAPEAPSLLRAAVALEREVAALTALDGCAVVLPTGAPPAIGPAPADALDALLAPTLFALDVPGALSGSLLDVVLVFFLVELFDATGTLMGVAARAGLLVPGRMDRLNKTLMADSSSIFLGSLLGTSSTTAYLESASGVQEGGRTGLTAATVAVLFLACLFIAPLAGSVPAYATAPTLFYVACLMLRELTELDSDELTEVVPACVTALPMPFTYSIANGVAFGFITYAVLKLVTGRARREARRLDHRRGVPVQVRPDQRPLTRPGARPR